jgi:ribosomal protein S18 acetylase RimI-like enzyme
VNIRPATLNDAAAISALGNSVKRNSQKSDQHWKSEGFLTYPKSEEKWRNLLSHPGGFGYIAEDENQKLLGYLVIYDHQLTAEEHGGPKPALSGFYEALVKHCDENTLYLEQIARHPNHRGKGIAHQLYEQLCKDYPKHNQLAGVVHAPIKNHASIRFFQEKLGFELIGEFQDESDELGAGLYFKKMS